MLIFLKLRPAKPADFLFNKRQDTLTLYLKTAEMIILRI